MIIKPHELKVKGHPYVNPKFIDKHLTVADHTFEIVDEIHYIDSAKRQLYLYIQVSFELEDTEINIAKVNFVKFFEIELHTDEAKVKYFTSFYYELYQAISEVKTYLLENIPNQIIRLKKIYLTNEVEIENKITSIYEKLIIRDF